MADEHICWCGEKHYPPKKVEPKMSDITLAEKLLCAERELKMRRSVYPRWVAKQNMSQPQADHEIRCMEAIVEDYRALVGKEPLPLFKISDFRFSK